MNRPIRTSHNRPLSSSNRDRVVTTDDVSGSNEKKKVRYGMWISSEELEKEKEKGRSGDIHGGTLDCRTLNKSESLSREPIPEELKVGQKNKPSSEDSSEDVHWPKKPVDIDDTKPKTNELRIQKTKEESRSHPHLAHPQPSLSVHKLSESFHRSSKVKSTMTQKPVQWLLPEWHPVTILQPLAPVIPITVTPLDTYSQPISGRSDVSVEAPVREFADKRTITQLPDVEETLRELATLEPEEKLESTTGEHHSEEEGLESRMSDGQHRLSVMGHEESWTALPQIGHLREDHLSVGSAQGERGNYAYRELLRQRYRRVSGYLSPKETQQILPSSASFDDQILDLPERSSRDNLVSSSLSTPVIQVGDKIKKAEEQNRAVFQEPRKHALERLEQSRRKILETLGSITTTTEASLISTTLLPTSITPFTTTLPLGSEEPLEPLPLLPSADQTEFVLLSISSRLFLCWHLLHFLRHILTSV